MPKQHKYKFRLASAVLATVCIVLVTDAIAPTAAIGNSQYFWWILMLFAFFVPYGLIAAELGTQYPSEGGLYTWVKKAFGAKWAGRVAWFYWIDFPLWITSLASLTTTIIMQMSGVELSWPLILAIQLFYIAFVSVLGILRVSQSDILSNIGAFSKIALMVGLGGLGIYVLCKTGKSANPISSWTDLLPLSQGIAGLGFISAILSNIMGFEVVSTFADDMEKPRKEIPFAIIAGGILIAILYLLPSFGIGVAIPYQELQTNTGFLDAYQSLIMIAGIDAATTKILIVIIGILFMYTLVANVISWNFGVNSVAAFAAEDSTFPKSWTKRNRDGVPYVPSIWTGLVAAVVSTAGILIANFVSTEVTNLFWTFFSMSLIVQMVTCLPMFMAFLKLHAAGKKFETGFWIHGGKFKIWAFALVPSLLVLFALFFTMFPEFNVAMFSYQWPLIVGTCLVVLVGEIMVASVHARNRKIARKAEANENH